MKASPAGDPDRPPRNLWVRPVCITLIAAMLPLDWKRVEVSGCSGQPSQVHFDRGWDLISEGAWLLGVLAALTLFLLWRSTRIDPNWRLFPATLGFLANAVVAFAIYFAATFELFSRARILWPGWVAMGSALALFVEGLTRFIAEILLVVRRRRTARRNRGLAPSTETKEPT